MIYLTSVCSLEDHCYYQAPDDDEVVKDCEEQLLASFSFYSSIARVMLEVAHSNSWWIIWQIVQEIWKASISPKPVYTRTRQMFPYASSLLEANEFVMEVSREVSWTVPNIFQSKKLLRIKLLFTAQYLRPKGNMGKFNHKRRKIPQMWREAFGPELPDGYMMPCRTEVHASLGKVW